MKSKKFSLTMLKYIFYLVITILTIIYTKNFQKGINSLLELSIIILMSDWLVKKNKILGNIFNLLLMLLYSIQLFSLYFGDNYVTLIMITNIDSIKALSGNFKKYFVFMFLMVVFMAIPIKSLDLFKTKKTYRLLVLVLFVEIIFVMEKGNIHSPYYRAYDLVPQYKAYKKRMKLIESQPNITREFYRGMTNAINKPDNLVEKPNIILIFMEGLSSHIIEDPIKVMPNVEHWKNHSLNFKNYYNHTFATYRGIIGQLYSGFQYNNLDTNSLVSIQSILKENGYNTAFVNTEPYNKNFSTYLESFGFDRVVGRPDKNYRGSGNTMSDKEAYEVLYETVQEESKKNKPFFISIYTFGTHMSLDSTDEIFHDGKNKFLNKFFNSDYYFGKFMEKIYNTELKENTMIVFTTDHATHVDMEYKETFKNQIRKNPDLDEIPLFIYYNGITPRTIDVQGRNSLNLVPTILDYVDIFGYNYFLGDTLFKNKDNGGNNYDTIFHTPSHILSTDNGDIRELSDFEREILEVQLEKYFVAKTQSPLKVEKK